MSASTTPLRAPTIDHSKGNVKSIEAMDDVPGMMRVSHIVAMMLLPVVPAVIVTLAQYSMGTSVAFYVVWAALGVFSVAVWAWLATHMMTRVRNTSTGMRIAGGLFLAWGMLLINVSLAFTGVVLLAGVREIFVAVGKSMVAAGGGS
jgi:hypothetical protein